VRTPEEREHERGVRMVKGGPVNIFERGRRLIGEGGVTYHRVDTFRKENVA